MFSRPNGTAILVTNLERTVRDGVQRISAVVDGMPVWFESGDTPLRASAEAFGSAFLIPVLHRRATLRLDAPASAEWHANLSTLVGTFHRWWGVPRRSPQVAAALPSAAERPAARTALCFSAGVDSFHALLHSGQSIHALVTAQGFDIPLDDEVRMRGLRASLEEVAAARGVRPIVIRTNLREHPLVRETAWERAHGGALAALAHLIDPEYGRLLIASSIPLHSRREWWGSHWKTDHLWSSSRVAVANVGGERRRIEKLRAIADEPLVQRHLRVCWENRAPTGNCSHCGKCLVAMLILAECGALGRFPVFEGADELAERLDALPTLRNVTTTTKDLLASRRLPPELLRAFQAVTRRTRRAQRPDVRARRYLLRTVAAWSRGGGA